MKSEARLAIDPEEWVKRYGEVITRTKAANLVGRNPSYITRRIQDGSLDLFRDGISVRQLAQHEIALVKRPKKAMQKNGQDGNDILPVG